MCGGPNYNHGQYNDDGLSKKDMPMMIILCLPFVQFVCHHFMHTSVFSCEQKYNERQSFNGYNCNNKFNERQQNRKKKETLSYSFFLFDFKNLTFLTKTNGCCNDENNVKDSLKIVGI